MRTYIIASYTMLKLSIFMNPNDNLLKAEREQAV